MVCGPVLSNIFGLIGTRFYFYSGGQATAVLRLGGVSVESLPKLLVFLSVKSPAGPFEKVSLSSVGDAFRVLRRSVDADKVRSGRSFMT